MSLTKVQGQGIRLVLASPGTAGLQAGRKAGGYYKVRSHQGGGNLISVDNEQLFRKYLGAFFPKAKEHISDERGAEIHYSLVDDDGTELCSLSEPVGPKTGIPGAELARLEEALGKLKEKAESSETDPTKAAAIRALLLPNPRTDLELYRLYRKGGEQRLLVLWGVEKDAGSSLAPVAAMAAAAHQSKRSNGRWAAVAALVVAILLLAALLWFRSNGDGVQPPDVDSDATPVVPLASPDSGGTPGGSVASQPPDGNDAGATPDGTGSADPASTREGSASGAPIDGSGAPVGGAEDDSDPGPIVIEPIEGPSPIAGTPPVGGGGHPPEKKRTIREWLLGPAVVDKPVLPGGGDGTKNPNGKPNPNEIPKPGDPSGSVVGGDPNHVGAPPGDPTVASPKIAVRALDHQVLPDGMVRIPLEILQETPGRQPIPLENGVVVFSGREFQVRDGRATIEGPGGPHELKVRGPSPTGPLTQKFSVSIDLEPRVDIIREE